MRRTIISTNNLDSEVGIFCEDMIVVQNWPPITPYTQKNELHVPWITSQYSVLKKTNLNICPEIIVT
jgi:hypothetical protein